jgi:hypothetical protein
MKSLAFAVIALALTGCATTKGLEVSADDAKECAEVGCTPWSEREIEQFARHVFRQGFEAGLKRGRGGL